VDGQPEGLPFDGSGESLRGVQMLNLRTSAGDLDLTFAPAAVPNGYEGLLPGAQPRTIGDFTVKVAGLAMTSSNPRKQPRVPKTLTRFRN
jgi:hypothetical protein